MDEFYHYCKPLPVHGDANSNLDAFNTQEHPVTDTPAAEEYLSIDHPLSDPRAEVLLICMFWWMSDGPNLVQVKVNPESYGHLFSAYKGTQCAFDFATREWDIFGRWGLAGFNPQDRHILKQPLLRLINPDNCICGVHNVLGYTGRLFDIDDNIPAPLTENPRPISYYLTKANFGISALELWRIQAVHDCTSLVEGLEFKELQENLDIAYLEDVQALARARYGYSNPKEGIHTIGLMSRFTGEMRKEALWNHTGPYSYPVLLAPMSSSTFRCTSTIGCSLTMCNTSR
jgi:hypothetical protein